MTNINKISFSKIFKFEDQKNFANLSGDYNPIHLSEKEARLTIAGECVCHGINSFLWALECLTRYNLNSYSEFKVKFIQFIPLNKQIDYVFDTEKNFISIYFDKLICSQIVLLKKNSLIKKEKNLGLEIKTPLIKGDILRIPEIKKQIDIKKSDFLKVKYSGDEKYAEKIFPYLTKYLGSGIVCQIASLSEVIGMRVPGLYSVFHKANIKIKDHKSPEYIKIIDSNIRFKRVIIGFSYPNIEGEIEGFFRPKPFQSKPCNELYDIFKPKKQDYKDKKVLIIGGSRGLGSCVAKLIAIRGGSLTISYNKGFEQAELLQKEINKWGSNCTIAKFDIFSDNFREIFNKSFDQLYYFASPRIKSNKNMEIDKKLLEVYNFYYVEMFKKLIKETKNSNIKRFFYPSTVYIDRNPPGFREYIQAKTNGEKFCDYINSKNKIILKPRLPKLITDQTASILPLKTADTYITLMNYIDEMVN